METQATGAAPPVRIPNPSAGPFAEGSPTSPAGIAGSIVAFLAFATFVWWSVDRIFGQPPPAMAVTSRSSTIIRSARPRPAAEPQRPVVRVSNPFDAAEVFEFPAGTSPAESQEKVAALLLQRASGRRGHQAISKPAEDLRAANLRTP